MNHHGFSLLSSSVSPPAPPPEPGVTENVRNSEDCIWVTIMLLNARLGNGKPIKAAACSDDLPPLQTSNVSYLTMEHIDTRKLSTQKSQ